MEANQTLRLDHDAQAEAGLARGAQPGVALRTPKR